MRHGVWNILDLAAEYGDGAIGEMLSDFTTSVSDDSDGRPLNPEIEHFLKNNALQFSKEKKSVTYVVGDEDDGSVLGYFTLAHKVIEIPAFGLSRTTLRNIDRYASPSPDNTYLISAFLIAQLGKNYGVDGGMRISGDELMRLAVRELCDVQHRIGGGLIYLDCEANAKLIRFYQDQQNFRLFGERISESDGKRYLQYMKFI